RVGKPKIDELSFLFLDQFQNISGSHILSPQSLGAYQGRSMPESMHLHGACHAPPRTGSSTYVFHRQQFAPEWCMSASITHSNGALTSIGASRGEDRTFLAAKSVRNP
ncbi:MAG: hypothetical protein U1F35_03085, partial [Steroidobacteraceae bacterium]